MDSSEGGTDIAAAIVHGAPVSRRRAFLRGLSQRAYSLEELVPGDLKRSRKRRSLNLDNTSTPTNDLLSLQSPIVSGGGGGAAAGGDQLQQNHTVGVAYGTDQLLSRTSPIEEANEDTIHESSPPVHLVQPSSLTLDAATPSLDAAMTSLDVVTPSSAAAASSTNGNILYLLEDDSLTIVTIHYSTLHGKYLVGQIMSYSPKLSSPIFTDTPKMYLAYALTVAYSPNFSLPIAFTCTVRQTFPLPYITHV